MELSDKELSYIYHPLLRPQPQKLQWWKKDRERKAQCVRYDLFSVSSYELPCDIQAADGKRIAFLSDFHYRDSALCRKKLASICRAVDGFSPDLLLLGGDMVADACTLETVPDMLKSLGGLAGAICAVPGNWEQGKLWMHRNQWLEIYRESGVPLLCNRHFVGEWFDLYGCEDPACGYPVIPQKWHTGKVRLLLSHRPDTLVALERECGKFHLGFAGHNHGGQLRLPLVGALYVPGNYRDYLSQGILRDSRRDSRIIISRGLGECSFPWRFNCSREVVLVTLRYDSRIG